MQIGERAPAAGVFIAPTAIVLGDVRLAPRSSVWFGSVLRADLAPIEIGEMSNIQDLSMLHVDRGVACTVGARVSVGHRAVLHGCRVESDCLIGIGAILLNRVVIGVGSVVAAGAVVTEGTNIPPASIVVGVPARVKGKVDDRLRQRIRHTWQSYLELAERYHSAG